MLGSVAVDVGEVVVGDLAQPAAQLGRNAGAVEARILVDDREDGATALEMYSHYVPDIVITDWAMPIFDGLELAQMIRQPESKGNPYAPIIMLTGHSEKRRVTVARDAGVTEFVAKPISAKGLYQRILNVVASCLLYTSDAADE